MKRLFCAVLTLALLFAASGCGKKEEVTEPIPTPIATITMKSGRVMTAELYPEIAPNTVANFVILANSGFYDGLAFHMIVPTWFILGGDPSGDGTGGPGYTIAGEFSDNGFANGINHMRGVLSMALRNNDDPNSAGSQFFIMHGAHPEEYDGKYAAFGKLIGQDSFDTLDALSALVCDMTNKKPLNLAEATIDTIRVDTKGHPYEVQMYEKPQKKK